MFVVYTGKQRNTAKLVEAVSQLKQNEPENFKELIGTIADVSAEMTELVQESNLDKYAIWDTVSMNQQYL
jgi:mevalonate kinase